MNDKNKRFLFAIITPPFQKKFKNFITILKEVIANIIFQKCLNTTIGKKFKHFILIIF